MNLIETARLYDSLYKEGEEILEKYGNPCEENFGKSLRTKDHYKAIECPCCDNCHFLGEHGCTTKALLCKLWVCRYVREKYPKMWEELKELLLKAYEAKLIIYRGSKRDLLQRKIDKNLGLNRSHCITSTKQMIEESYYAAIDLLI